MAGLPGCALCLMLATAAMGLGENDVSGLLQVDTAPASGSWKAMASGSWKAIRADLQSLSVLAKKNVEQRGKSLANSTALMSVAKSHMKDAHNFIVNKISKEAAKSKSWGNCGFWCISSSILDGIAIAWEAVTSDKKSDETCLMPLVFYWWLTGIFTLTVDQKLGFPDAVHMLVQQFTSVGYGSNTPNTTTDAGLMIFHGLHGVLSQLSVNKATMEIYDWALGLIDSVMSENSSETTKASVALVFVLAITTLIFTLDIEGTDVGNKIIKAIYGTLITATTIGYGDVTPTSPFAKVFSTFSLPFVVEAFGKWATAVKGDKRELPKPSDTLSICKCGSGESWCPRLPTAAEVEAIRKVAPVGPFGAFPAR